MTKNPEFTIFTGPMFGGKTSRMLAALDRAKYQDRKVVAFKPKIDHRYEQEKIVTHTGYSMDAICINVGDDIAAHAINADIVAVDEAFMIDGVAKALIDLYLAGKTIYVSTLQLSANNIVFSEVAEMLPWASSVEVCPAVCSVCGRDAYFTVAKMKGLAHIEVGGAETYEPRCHEHAFTGKEKKNES